MTKLIALNNKIHSMLKISTEKSESHGEKLSTVPVMLSEFLRLAVQFPILLNKNKETGQFVCVSMLGLFERENLFWINNHFDALYKPLHIARQPFFLGLDDDKNEGQYLVCFDAESESIQASSGEALFDAEGKETAYLQKMQAILAELLAGEKKIKAFVDKLVALNLLQAMRMDINFNNGESHKINGMYTIDESQLKTLPADTIAELHSLDYLSYIYIMIASMGQIHALVQRKNQRLEFSKKSLKAS